MCGWTFLDLIGIFIFNVFRKVREAHSRAVITTMNKYLIYLILIFFSLSINSSCTERKKQTSANPVEQLRWLCKANPEQDAKQAIAKSDFRLMAVYGYTLIIPGTKGDFKKYEKFYGIRPILGTSDAIQNEEHGTLNALASEYALKYNRIILKQKKLE